MKSSLLLIFLFACISFSLQAQTAQKLTLQTFTTSDEEVLFLDQKQAKVAVYNPKQEIFTMDEYEIKNEVIYFKNDSIASLKGNKLMLNGKEYKFKTKFLSFKKANVVIENEKVFSVERKNEKIHLSSIPAKQKVMQAWVVYYSYKWAKRKQTSKDSWVLGITAGLAASIAAALL